MTAASGEQTATIVHRTIREAFQPSTLSNRLLFVWDEGADEVLGTVLVDQIADLLDLGFLIDVLAPTKRLDRLRVLGRPGEGRGSARNARIIVEVAAANEYSLISVVLHGKYRRGGAPQPERRRPGDDGAGLPALSGHPVVILNSCWGGSAAYDEALAIDRGLATD